jgi:CelD/BcsL family acetyltransferase involved in cellulose biosynthesis
MRAEFTQKDRLIDGDIVEGAERISEFGEQWDDLFARAVDAPPYLARSWVSTFIEGGRLLGTAEFMLAWCEGKLVALFPLAVRKVLGVKVAVPIGTGQNSYLGLLLDPDYQSAVNYIATLIRSKKVFDVFYNTDLYSEDSATNNLLARLAEQGYFRRSVFRDPAHYIQLGCSFDEYLKRKIPKGKRRYKLRFEERKLFQSADVRVIRYIGQAVTSEINKRVAEIQLGSWMKRRGGAVLWQPFYQKLLANMARAGFSYVWLMTINGDDAAFAYAFVAHGKLHYYWPAFKLKYESSLSVGQILLMQVVRDACNEGIVSFDFLHGDAEYKRFWATNTSRVERVVVCCGYRGYLIAVFYYLAWRLAGINCLRSFYHRIRMIIRRFKQRTAMLQIRGY